jgi:opacity protein-like surface antigen
MVIARVLAGGLAALLSGTAGAAAQVPDGPPPPPLTGGDAGSRYLELLPDIGRIGAQVAAFGGASWSPYGVGQGIHIGGLIDLPLARNRAGRLSYEIHLALSRGESPAFTTTDPLAVLANRASGASAEDARVGPPRAPFLVRREVRTRLNVLQVSPFGLKYTLTGLDARRLRPYLGAGVDVAFVTSEQRPAQDGAAPFEATAPEVLALGLPRGQGNVELGAHAAGGVEIRVSRGLSVNAEYRFTTMTAGDRLHTATGGLGIHW